MDFWGLVWFVATLVNIHVICIVAVVIINPNSKDSLYETIVHTIIVSSVLYYGLVCIVACTLYANYRMLWPLIQDKAASSSISLR